MEDEVTVGAANDSATTERLLVVEEASVGNVGVAGEDGKPTVSEEPDIVEELV